MNEKDGPPKPIDAWLIWYSEGDTYPTCIFFEPKFPEHYFDIKKIKLIFEN